MSLCLPLCKMGTMHKGTCSEAVVVVSEPVPSRAETQRPQQEPAPSLHLCTNMLTHRGPGYTQSLTLRPHLAPVLGHLGPFCPDRCYQSASQSRPELGNKPAPPPPLPFLLSPSEILQLQGPGLQGRGATRGCPSLQPSHAPQVAKHKAHPVLTGQLWARRGSLPKL